LVDFRSEGYFDRGWVNSFSLSLGQLYTVSDTQITLDGPRDIHDKRGPLKSGQGTFVKILNNIAEVIDIIPNLYLRINVDKDNINRVEEILDELDRKGLKNKVYVYLGYVEPTNDCYLLENCLLVSEYSKISFYFDNILKNKGFENDLLRKYPETKNNFCGADRLSSLAIDPEGYIYKCWSDIGREEYKIGNILDNLFKNIDKYLTYILYDPTLDPLCKDCKLLPICMGGCPRRRIDKRVDRCVPYKYVLEEYIQNVAEDIIKRKQYGLQV